MRALWLTDALVHPLQRAQARKKLLTRDRNEHKVTVVKRGIERDERREQIKAPTALVAARILGEGEHGRFISDSEMRPFQLAREGEAYQVLEMLIDDMVCLLDAATSKSSHHPGFVVHDCPLEADMSGRLYSEYLLLAGEAESQLSNSGGVPFQ